MKLLHNHDPSQYAKSAYFQNYSAGRRYCDHATAAGYGCLLFVCGSGWKAMAWKQAPPKPLEWYERHPILAGIVMYFLFGERRA